MNDYIQIAKIAVKKIQDQLFLYSIVVIVFLVALPQFRWTIISIYLFSSIAHIAIKIYKETQKTPDRRYLDNFEFYIENSEWRKEVIDHTRIWFCKEDNAYQIELGESIEKFSEEWTRKHPDSEGSFKKPLYLKVHQNKIKELTYVSCDGGRIEVPLPDCEEEKGETIFYYEKESFKYKLAQVVRDLYRFDSLHDFAESSGIEIRG